ncbi:MAG: radical SAM protein [Candidatus Omnitrophica bacterium]|nr:radical SAM protein [Candidatus Omnitrophota bacterium]
MTKDNYDKRNFLFFINETHPVSIEDSLTGALASPSSWDAVAAIVNTARQQDAFVRSIKKVQLYVHVPFCGRLCSFCHCLRVLLRQRSDIDAYIKTLLRQMMLLAPAYKGMDAASICFGGGTPSILDEPQMTAILDGVDKAFPARNRKVLFEVNPSSWTASKLALLSNRGLFRLSIGVQSLDENILKKVSRFQTRQKSLWCLRSARKAGIPHVNVDLIAGLPGQTVKGLIKDLKVVIDEGANIVHVQPYSSLSQLFSPGETPFDFLNRRDAMMKAAAEILVESGFHRKGFGAYTRDDGGEDFQEEAYSRLEAAVAAFGPFAKGQVPGAVFYRVGTASPMADLPSVDVSVQDFGYAMAQYAMFALINGLDENVFFRRFGVPLEQHCGEGLKYLQEFGLVAFSKGIWKFSGKWEVRRIFEYAALSRALFGEDFLLRLRERFIKQYDPRQDYSKGRAFFRAYADNWLMTLYYQMGV